MPRGWMKNQRRDVGRKVSRGGSSLRQRAHQKTKPIKERSQHRVSLVLEDDDIFYNYDDSVYDDVEQEDEGQQEKCQSLLDYSSKGENSIQGECPICCEVRPLVPLLKNCNHSPSCVDCLREIYVNQAQQNISNYPLKCYHPSCRKPVRDTQLIRHGLVHSEKELRKHYRFSVLSKVYSQQTKVVYCPDCDAPQEIKNERFVKCRQCHTGYEVDHDPLTTKTSTIDVIESLKHDKFGRFDGWASCPQCKMTISKGYGCDHMVCFCGMDFSWDGALRATQSRQKNVKTVVVKQLSKIT